jgi:hypothetical protein
MLDWTAAAIFGPAADDANARDWRFRARGSQSTSQPAAAFLPLPCIGADGVEASRRAPIQRFVRAPDVSNQNGHIACAPGRGHSPDTATASALERGDDFGDRTARVQYRRSA